LIQFLSSLELLKPKEFEPMWVRLASEQLRGNFSDPFRYARSHETTVIEEELKHAQIGITEALP